MNANELADEVMEHYRAELPRGFNVNWMQEAATMLRQQQEEKKALYNLVAEQDKKIIDLAFKLAYAERSNEIVLEANTRSRP